MISETEYLLIFGVMMMATLFLSIMILADRLNRIENILFDEKPKRKQAEPYQGE